MLWASSGALVSHVGGQMIDGEMKWTETAITHMQLKSFIARAHTRRQRAQDVGHRAERRNAASESVEVRIDDGPWQPATMDQATRKSIPGSSSLTPGMARHLASTLVSRVTDVARKSAADG